MHYKRSDIKGGTFFFTVNLNDRSSTLLIDEVDKLKHVINQIKTKHPFRLDALVILPDHLHAI